MPLITVSVANGVGIVELSRPDKFNCLSPELHDELNAAIDDLVDVKQARAIMVCSQGKQFCTGADLDAVQEYRANPKRLGKFMQKGHDALKKLEAAPVPTIVAVQGLCLAGGLELMLACDVAFAAETARFGDQHGQFGLVPGWGGSQRLTRIVGLRRAMDLFYSVRWLDAKTALEWGLVNYVVPDATLREAALDYCNKLTERSATGLAAMKQLARDGLDVTLNQGLAMEERVAIRALMEPDVDEGLSAFTERRKPVFNRG